MPLPYRTRNLEADQCLMKFGLHATMRRAQNRDSWLVVLEMATSREQHTTDGDDDDDVDDYKDVTNQ